MSNVSSTRLGDLINLKRGYDLPESQRHLGPYPVISSAGISGYHNEYKVEGTGVVTGRYGTLGEMYFVEGKYWPHNTALYVTTFKGNNPKYIYYLLSCLGRIRTSDKSAVPGVNRNELHEMAVPAIEDKNQQKKIAAVLSPLDAKIDCNNRINAELEAMAKTLYDYWFVQFDFPDANGKPYKSSGGKMVYNPTLKREIPEGWLHSTIGETFRTHLGGTPSRGNDKYWKPGEVNWLSSGENPSTFVVAPDETISTLGLQNSPAKLLPQGTVILSIVRHLRASILGIEAATNQSVVGIVETEKFKHCFIYPYLVREIPRLMALRTGAQQPHINKGVLDESLLVIPDDTTLSAYNTKAAPLFLQIQNSLRQSMELTQLRDWLLPMLMNGQITVA